jgi:hypothetical protein
MVSFVFLYWLHHPLLYRIGSVMVSVLASNAIDRGFEHRSDQIKDHNIGMCCFSLSTQH